ncbi:plasma membrane-associated cation-binding protein 1-like [Wolffia australiana]
MGYWKSKVIPTIKKVFEKGSAKKAAAAEATKTFEDSKEGIGKEFEEKKAELGPKLLEIYGASSPEIKTLVKERKETGLKKQAGGVNKFLEELVKIEFPGAKTVSEISSKFGPALVPGPVFFLFEKVAAFVPAEEAAPPAPAAEGTSKDKEAEVAAPEEKKIEAPPAEEKKAEAETSAAPEAPVIKEDKPPTVVEVPPPAAEAPPPAAEAPPPAAEAPPAAAEPEKTTAAAEPPKA